MPFTRDVSQHSQTQLSQGALMRTASPAFVATPPSGMREPGTPYLTLLTSPGGNANYEAMGIKG
jgi:hypothetical protein